MMSSAGRLMQRRTMLVAECALQRSTLAAQSRQLGASFKFDTSWLKTGEGLLERLRNLPSWVSVALAAAVVFMPGRFAKLARSGLMLWQFWRNLKSATDSK